MLIYIHYLRYDDLSYKTTLGWLLVAFLLLLYLINTIFLSINFIYVVKIAYKFFKEYKYNFVIYFKNNNKTK